MPKTNKELQADFRARQRENANLVVEQANKIKLLESRLQGLLFEYNEKCKEYDYILEQNQDLMKDKLLNNKRRERRKEKRIADKFE